MREGIRCRELIRAKNGGWHAEPDSKGSSVRPFDASSFLHGEEVSYTRDVRTYGLGVTGGLMKTWALRNKMDAPVSVCLSRGKATEARRSRRGIVRAPLHPCASLRVAIYTYSVRTYAMQNATRR